MKIEEGVEEGKRLLEIQDAESLKIRYDMWCSEMKRLAEESGFPEEKQREIRVKMHYTENEYSEGETRKSILKALGETISCLQGTIHHVGYEMSRETALMMLNQILGHFYMFYRAMFGCPVHKKGTLSPQILREIQIGNEYDLQRMVYALLLPVFPTARQEVNSDGGYKGMRADIYLEEYDIVIELKCTRDGMTEKRLTEEMGADGFHYKAGTIFFLVYDRNAMIGNPEAFAKAFERNIYKDGKMVKVFVVRKGQI